MSLTPEFCDYCAKPLTDPVTGLRRFYPVYEIIRGVERHLAFCSKECFDAYSTDQGIDWSTAVSVKPSDL